MSNWLEQLFGDTQTRLLRLLRRSRQSITELATALKLTDNAVRTHMAVLRREGIVEDVGTQRDTGGKPARLYGLTPATRLTPATHGFARGYGHTVGRALRSAE